MIKNSGNNGLKVPYIAWEFQTICNMGCEFCYSSSWNQKRYQGKNLLDPSVMEIHKALTLLKMADIGVNYINWTGGEPLRRHADLKVILPQAKKLNFNNIVSTNCMFTPLFKNPDNKPIDNFSKYIMDINSSLSFLSISWDAADKDFNNNIMRRNVSNTGGSKYHFDDVHTFLEMYRSNSYDFKLKVNTLVSSVNYNPVKNIDQISGIYDVIKDLDCIWKLIQFNPRECPNEYKFKYGIQKEIFLSLFNKLSEKSKSDTNSCIVTKRIYEGNNEPYCFLVINTPGDVLLPKGEKHIPLVNIYNYKGSHVDFKNEISEKITEELKKTETYNESAYNGNRKSPITVFSNLNRNILDTYLHTH